MSQRKVDEYLKNTLFGTQQNKTHSGWHLIKIARQSKKMTHNKGKINQNKQNQK